MRVRAVRPFVFPAPPFRWRRPILRRARLARHRARRVRRRIWRRLVLLSGWTWVAAASLVGFEMFDVVFGTVVLAPEILPFVIVGLVLVWLFRERLRRVRARLRLCWAQLRLRLRWVQRSDRPH